MYIFICACVCVCVCVHIYQSYKTLLLIFMKPGDFLQIIFQKGTCHEVEANRSFE